MNQSVSRHHKTNEHVIIRFHLCDILCMFFWGNQLSEYTILITCYISKILFASILVECETIQYLDIPNSKYWMVYIYYIHISIYYIYTYIYIYIYIHIFYTYIYIYKDICNVYSKSIFTCNYSRSRGATLVMSSRIDFFFGRAGCHQISTEFAAGRRAM